ncbi:MAG: hypothetical protein F4Z25_05640, partial [Chloroflexi bacterium]|nr:hypothetical protein [Chloroflexota bacterium]
MRSALARTSAGGVEVGVGSARAVAAGAAAVAVAVAVGVGVGVAVAVASGVAAPPFSSVQEASSAAASARP